MQILLCSNTGMRYYCLTGGAHPCAPFFLQSTEEDSMTGVCYTTRGIFKMGISSCLTYRIPAFFPKNPKNAGGYAKIDKFI